MAGLSKLIPLIILFVVVGVAAFIGWGLYQWSNELAERASKKMEKKNMSFTKDGGLRVGVKGMQDEQTADKTQNILVNVWNNAALPNYKSSLGWNSTQADRKKAGAAAAPRPAVSRSSSSQSQQQPSRPASSTASTSGSTLSPPPQSSSQRRSASPVPGGWE